MLRKGIRVEFWPSLVLRMRDDITSNEPNVNNRGADQVHYMEILRSVF
jgi:hypothetical protein